MDEMAKKFRTRGGYTKGNLLSINRCRRYLRVTTISDVCNGDGTKLMKWALDCQKQHKHTHISANKYKWPPQGYPSTSDRLIWKQALLDTIGNGTMTLKTKLGKWLSPSAEATNWKYDPATDRIYRKSDIGWTVWLRTCQRRTCTAK